MSEAFDPYHRWLGIPPKDQPPHHYRLLGIDLFEQDTEVIRDAAERQMAHVRNYQLGQHSSISQKILNELAAAKSCLVDRDKKAIYDAAIKAKLGASKSSTERLESKPGPPSSPAPSPPPPPPAPTLSPSISKTRPLPLEIAAGMVKTSDLIGKRGSLRRNINWLLYIPIGTGVILGGILVTIFVMNRGSEIPKSNSQIKRVTGSAEQNPPDRPARSEMPGSDKTAEQRVSKTLPIPPPPDEKNNPVDNHSAATESRVEDVRPPSDTEKKPDINVPQQQNKAPDQVSIQTPSSPIIPIEPGHEAQYPVSTIRLDLKNGKVFNSDLFDVDVKSNEEELKDEFERLKNTESEGQVILWGSVDGDHALAKMGKIKYNDVFIMKQQGVFLAFYDNRTPKIYATYSNGKCEGIFKKWNASGEREYWCQYKNDKLQGFCAYFKDDILRIVIERNGDKYAAVYLCCNNELIKSFDSREKAVADEYAIMYMDEVHKIELELKSMVSDYENNIKKEYKKGQIYINNQIIKKHNQERRNKYNDDWNRGLNEFLQKYAK